MSNIIYMDKKTTTSTKNYNLKQWHCSEICDYVKYLHGYIGELEANNYALNSTVNELIDKDIASYSEISKADDRILALEADLSDADKIISGLTGKVRELVAEKFTPSSEKRCYHKGECEVEGENSKKDDVGVTVKLEIEGEVNEKNSNGSENVNEQKQECHDPINIVKKIKKRGARQGHKGYGRKIPENLPIEVVTIEIDGDKTCCGICGAEYRQTAKTEDSVKINVKIIVEKIISKRAVYVKECDCIETPTFLSAPKPEAIIPKSLYTNGFWCLLLVLKYYFQIPLNRQMNIFDMYHYKPNASTIIGGFKKLLPLLIPLYNKLKAEILKDNHWHCDETRWLVFEEKADKKTHLWWLWTFVSKKLNVFVLDSTRSSSVPEKFFGKDAKGIVNVDRYAAYNVLLGGILLAFCWYHLRRDFLKAQISFPELTSWAEEWLKYISKTEELNSQRLSCETGSTSYESAQIKLVEHLNGMKTKVEEQLQEDKLIKKQETILKSLNRKWEGYTVFVDNPHVPMHNNVAENSLRPAALGRNSYYGSHVEWSGLLAAACMTIFQSAEKNGIMPIKYLEFYFGACQKNGGKPPEDLEIMLPWNAKEYMCEFNDMEIKSG